MTNTNSPFPFVMSTTIDMRKMIQDASSEDLQEMINQASNELRRRESEVGLTQSEWEAIEAGRSIDAIKKVRNRLSVTLMRAKEIVEKAMQDSE